MDHVSSILIGSVHDECSEADLFQIRALEWLSFDPSQSSSYLNFSNLLIRRFLVNGKVHCVKRIIEYVSLNQSMDDTMSMMIKERHEYETLVASLEHHDQWINLFNRNPERLKSNLVMVTPTAEWKQELKDLTETTVDLFSKLLAGTIFGTEFDSSIVDPGKLEELKIMRSLYIPELVMWLHHLLLSTHDIHPHYLEASMDLANLVAGSVGNGLFEAFIQAGKLDLFLRAMRDSSLVALGQKTLPWYTHHSLANCL